jgi:hypothetical protein
MGWSYFHKFNDVILFLRDDVLDDNEVPVVIFFNLDLSLLKILRLRYHACVNKRECTYVRVYMN